MDPLTIIGLGLVYWFGLSVAGGCLLAGLHFHSIPSKHKAQGVRLI